MTLQKRTVYNTIVDEKGNPIAGEEVRVYLVKHAFATGEPIEVIRYGVEAQSDQNGYWEISLVPNDLLEGDTYYIIEEGRPTSRIFHQHFIRLPSGSTPIALKDIRITPPYQSVGISAEQIVSAIIVDDDALKGQVKLVAGEGVSVTSSPTQKTVTIAQKPQTVWQKIAVLVNGTLYGIRSKLNLVAGNNVSLSPTDDPDNDTVHVTINNPLECNNHAIGITVGDGQNPVTTGIKGAVWIPFTGTITEWTILSIDANPPSQGSIEFDILKSSYANYPTMTSIIGNGTKPHVFNDTKGNGTPEGWTTTQINAGDCLRFDVTSVVGFKRVTLVLKVVKSQ